MDDSIDATTRPATTLVGQGEDDANATTTGSTSTSTNNNSNNNETSTSNKRSSEDDPDNNNHNNKKKNHRPWEKKKKRKPSSEKERNRAKHSNYNVHVDERTTAMGPHEGSFANPAMRQQFQIEWTVDDQAKEDKTVGVGGVDDQEKDNDDDPEREETNTTSSTATTTKKRKVALLVGFLGTKYGGFQVNMEQRTIQATLELALYRAGLIHGSNFGRPHKYTWSTSARTDKGVHACAQVCSLKLELLSTDEDDDDDDEDDDDKNQKKQHGKNNKKKAAKHQQQQCSGGGTLESVRLRVQQHLPPDIGILDVLRCTRNFCAKTQRDRVRYSYMIPSFLFHPEIRSIFTEEGIPLDGREDAARAPLSTLEVQALQRRLGSYRSTPDQRASLQAALSSYQGTHSFHNFTKGVKPGQATANRYILEFTVEDPVLVGSASGENANDDNRQQQQPHQEQQDPQAAAMEWIPTYVIGQSFLLHQIRKMISLAIDVARGAAPLSVVTTHALHRKKEMRVSLAPAQGLFLEMSYFMGYNRRKRQQPASRGLPDLDWSNGDGGAGGTHATTTMTTTTTTATAGYGSTPSTTNSITTTPDMVESPARLRWRTFRDEIRKHIVEEEQSQGNFFQYLYTQECIFEYKKFYGLEKDPDHYGGDDGTTTTTFTATTTTKD
jgi:tRNA pseudouridine38-40 synthase